MNDKKLGRLRWKCRRGMLELDIMLLDFFDQCYTDLSVEQQACFERLLDEDDTDLYTWILGHGQPSDPEFAALIAAIVRNKESCHGKNVDQ